jgi:2-dehydro-3-deoxy-D-arabinonate dehydratase
MPQATPTGAASTSPGQTGERYLVTLGNAEHTCGLVTQRANAAHTIQDTGLTFSQILRRSGAELRALLHRVEATAPDLAAIPGDGPRPINVAPAGDYEVWAAGVTYKRSEEAREAESHQSNLYTRVYHAPRPELFFKALGPAVVGSGESVGIRYDARWSVPEPELVVVLSRSMEVIGFMIGNDMSSRDIEGDNPLYLPQAKVYDRSCALGARVWLQPGAEAWPEVHIEVQIERKGEIVWSATMSTTSLKRHLPELVDYLGRCKQFPNGALLFSGTGAVPPDEFTLIADDVITITANGFGTLSNHVVVIGA